MIHSRLPQRMTDIVFQGIGLFTMAIGISMSLKSDNMLLAVISIVAGTILGEWIGIDIYLKRFADWLQSQNHKKIQNTKLQNTATNKTRETTNGNISNFTEGFITASMLFCVGSMSIMGAIEEGTGGQPNLLFTKSIMDGISSIALASTFGISILFSSIPVLIYQGGLTLFAAFIMHFMNDTMINDLTSVGGILLIGLGINILKIKNINVINMLPALIIIVILSYFWG